MPQWGGDFHSCDAQTTQMAILRGSCNTRTSYRRRIRRRAKAQPSSRHGKPYRKKDFRIERPALVVAVPIGCLAYSTFRTTFGVARRLSEPAVLLIG